MRLVALSLGVITSISLAAGCVTVPPDDESAEGEDVGVATSAQIDPLKSYFIKQFGVIQAASFAGYNSAGNPVEYWVAKPSYQSGSTRTFEGATQSCADWKNTVCSTAWAGATYYQANYTQETLDCGYPPDPCQPPTGAISFLGAGSYQTRDSAGAPFAWTYSTGTCEYWSMYHTISTGTNTQSRLGFTQSYSSLTDFVNKMCLKNPVPSNFYKASYSTFANFCSASTC